MHHACMKKHEVVTCKTPKSRHAEALVTMADKITTEFLSLDNVLGGEIYFGLGYAIRSNNAKK